MNSSRVTSKVIVGGYFLLFFAYLFGPLIIMSVSAFNSYNSPRISPWDCFTTEWFTKLYNDDRLLEGLENSLLIGIGVVVIAVPIGLAAALMLSQIGERFRAVMYTIFIAPILVPGVVLGISTLIFWGQIGGVLGEQYETLFFNGMFMTILGQVTFISAYSMLIFISRLQRFDATQTEAALDLGASPAQAFRKILLPFLVPAIGSSAVLAFLASMENYNTTVFTILSDSTFTTVLASKVRYGIDPSISAVAVIIIGLTLVAAMIHEAHTRRQERITDGTESTISPAYRFLAHPAVFGVILVASVALISWYATSRDPAVCKANILEQKRALQQKFLEENKARALQPGTTTPKAKTGFGSVFDPSNLGEVAPETQTPAAGDESGGTRTTPKAKTGFGGVFAPGNLDEVAPEEDKLPTDENTKPFGGVFAPTNLDEVVPKSAE